MTLAGCGGAHSLALPDGRATVSRNGHQVTVKAKGGTATFSGGTTLPPHFPTSAVPLPSGATVTSAVSADDKGTTVFELTLHVPGRLAGVVQDYAATLRRSGFSEVSSFSGSGSGSGGSVLDVEFRSATWLVSLLGSSHDLELSVNPASHA